MTGAAAELWKWLEAGAHFYVCGDAQRMTKDVENVGRADRERCGDRNAESGGSQPDGANTVEWMPFTTYPVYNGSHISTREWPLSGTHIAWP